MTASIQYYAVLLAVIVPFCLIGEIWSMRSLTQYEGGNHKNYNDAVILARQGEQKQSHDHGQNLEKFVGTINDDDEDNGHDVALEKKKGIRRQKGIHKTARKHKKKTKQRKGRRNQAKIHKSAKQKRPADVVLLVDATGSMLSWFSERMNRVQNITRSLALQFLESNHHNRIAIAQFDYYQGKILLELEKWQAPTINRAVSQLKCPGEYAQTETIRYEEEYYSAFTAALMTAKNIFTNSLREEDENYDRIAILITDGMEYDRVNEAKIIRKQLNVHIMAVIVAEDVESAKKDFYNDPELEWESVQKHPEHNPVHPQ